MVENLQISDLTVVDPNPIIPQAEGTPDVEIDALTVHVSPDFLELLQFDQNFN